MTDRDMQQARTLLRLVRFSNDEAAAHLIAVALREARDEERARTASLERTIDEYAMRAMR